MARNRKTTNQVDKEAAYIKGVAKNLVDRLYGPKGPAWGTKFTEIEATVAAIREVLSEEMFQQALSRQAAETERPPEYAVCPGCGRPTPQRLRWRTAWSVERRGFAAGRGIYARARRSQPTRWWNRHSRAPRRKRR